MTTASYRFGRFELRPATRELLADGQPATLGARAFDVLNALIERREQLVTKDELLVLVWPGRVVEENNLQVHISALRKILGPNAITTVAGRGFQFRLKMDSANPSPAPRQSANPSAPTAAEIPSIAVLPFINISDDPANEYFADGLSEQLISVLSKIRGLRVVARSSSFTFKGKAATVAAVGDALNVATVLEGSVRKSGSLIRISVQLVHAGTDTHLWSETYDRTLEDIFAVQDDIARSVLMELRPALLGPTSDLKPATELTAEVASAARGRSTDPEAYRLFLQARYFIDRLNLGFRSLRRGSGRLKTFVGARPTDRPCASLLVVLPEYARPRRRSVGRGVAGTSGIWASLGAGDHSSQRGPPRRIRSGATRIFQKVRRSLLIPDRGSTRAP